MTDTARELEALALIAEGTAGRVLIAIRNAGAQHGNTSAATLESVRAYLRSVSVALREQADDLKRAANGNRHTIDMRNNI